MAEHLEQKHGAGMTLILHLYHTSATLGLDRFGTGIVLAMQEDPSGTIQVVHWYSIGAALVIHTHCIGPALVLCCCTTRTAQVLRWYFVGTPLVPVLVLILILALFLVLVLVEACRSEKQQLVLVCPPCIQQQPECTCCRGVSRMVLHRARAALVQHMLHRVGNWRRERMGRRSNYACMGPALDAQVSAAQPGLRRPVMDVWAGSGVAPAHP